MKIQAIVPVWADSDNSNPPDLKVLVDDTSVTLFLENLDREITIKKSEFQALMRFVNLGGDE